MSKTTNRDKNGLNSASSHGSHASAQHNGAGRDAEIARLAYAKAEARGFAPGHEMEDWLEAEAEWSAEPAEGIDCRLDAHPPSRTPATRGSSPRR